MILRKTFYWYPLILDYRTSSIVWLHSYLTQKVITNDIDYVRYKTQWDVVIKDDTTIFDPIAFNARMSGLNIENFSNLKLSYLACVRPIWTESARHEYSILFKHIHVYVFFPSQLLCWMNPMSNRIVQQTSLRNKLQSMSYRNNVAVVACCIASTASVRQIAVN